MGSLVRGLYAALAFTLACSSFANAKTKRPILTKTRRPISAEELFKTYSPAVVKIIIKQQSIPVTIGSGFFVSSDGNLITNHHVMRAAISNPGFSAEFQLSDKRVVSSFKVADCGDKRAIDLCLLKLDVKPSSHFTLVKHTPAPGEAIFVIGHPQGLDFSISNGIVSALRRTLTGIDEVQISAAISAGNSGGPIFNDRGQLVGVATKYLAGGQNLNFGILTNEILAYHEGKKVFMAPAEARHRIVERTKAELRRQAQTEIHPALALALANARGSHEKASTKTSEPAQQSYPKSFKEMAFDFGDQTLKMQVPTLFDPCQKTREDDRIMHVCFGLSESVAFSLQRFSLKSPGMLSEMNGKALLPPRPMSIVERLEQDGSWSGIFNALTPAQKQSFYSRPSLAQCHTLRPNKFPGAAFNSVPTCKFTVEDDNEPNGTSVNLWVESGSYLYAFAIWMNDAGLLEYFQQVPTIALFSSRLEDRDGKSIAPLRPPAGSKAREAAPKEGFDDSSLKRK